MRKYNLNQIMKDVHKFCRRNLRMSKNFDEYFKLTWSLMRDTINFKEERKAKMQYLFANKQLGEYQFYNDIKIVRIAYYNSNGRNYMNSQYCGD